VGGFLPRVPVEPPSVRRAVPNVIVFNGISLSEEDRVSGGFAVDLSVIGADVENLALSIKGVDVDANTFPTP
jgi:hypothetical protein